MSSVKELQEEVVATYILTSSNVLVLYESMLTICEEVNVIWRRKWTLMTWIYALTRYSTVALIIGAFSPVGNIKSCKAGIYSNEALVSIPFPCFALFSALRVYALSDGRQTVAGIVFILNLVPLAINTFTHITDKVVIEDELCQELLLSSANLRLILPLISRISVIMGDTIVLVVTWMKTAQSYREAQRLDMKAPLAAMLIRDGTIYFVILLVINALQVFGKNVPILSGLDVVDPFFEIIQPLIVCRFILKLRQVKPAGDSGISGNQSRTSRFVGNIGETLYFGGEEEDDNEAGGDAADDLPEITTATAGSSGEVNEREGGSHLDFDIQEVPVHFDV